MNASFISGRRCLNTPRSFSGWGMSMNACSKSVLCSAMRRAISRTCWVPPSFCSGGLLKILTTCLLTGSPCFSRSSRGFNLNVRQSLPKPITVKPWLVDSESSLSWSVCSSIRWFIWVVRFQSEVFNLFFFGCQVLYRYLIIATLRKEFYISMISVLVKGGRYVLEKKVVFV